MEIKPIHNDADLAAALAEIERGWGAPQGTPDGDRLEVLTALVEAYERATAPAQQADPRALIRFYLEQNGLDDSALDAVFGSADQRRMAMDGSTPLTVPVIDALHERFGIARELLAPALLPRRAA
jgi:HTH-type transcriptional regulator/antitoxin HigA